MRSSGRAPCAGVTRKPGCTLGTSITPDPALTTAVGEGIHAVPGELFAPDLSPEAQHLVGKRFNSALLASCGPRGLLEQLHKAGVSMTLQEAELARVAWWAQFPVLSTFVRAWLGWIRVLRSSGAHLRRHSGKRSLPYYEASSLGGNVSASAVLVGDAHDPEGAVRQVLPPLVAGAEGGERVDEDDPPCTRTPGARRPPRRGCGCR